jgi:murein DD-endopeptidase MepM/ murein hydrolase activator NlpD
MRARIQEQNAYRVERFFDSQRSLLSSTPTIWPVRGWITSSFGHRVSPFTGTLQMHEGLDICARTGTPVKATADGIVIYSGWKSEFGKTVTLDHGYGYRTRYAHLARILVNNGQRVSRGEVLGALGNSGRSTGPHLHYEVKLNGLPVDPRRHLLD